MSQAEFYLFCGELLGHEVREEGEAPHQAFAVHFEYERGWASFDGARWGFGLTGGQGESRAMA